MKFGIAVGNFGTFGKQGEASDLIEIARRAEQLNFDSVWLHDHLFMPATIRARYPYNESGVAGFAYRQDIYDPLALMAGIAVRTSRIQIGTSVLIIPYRNPIVLARMLATIDNLSNGRVLLGMGVGWMAEEFDALGIGNYYPIRGTVTDEWVRIMLALWTASEPVTFKGRFHSFERLDPFPRPVQQPHIPLWVGGNGDAAARRVARYGNGFHTITSTADELRTQLAGVHAEMERRGRDPSELVISMLGPALVIGGSPDARPGVIGGSRQEMIDRLGELQRAGLEHAIVLPTFANRPGPTTPERMQEGMEFFASELMPSLR